MSCSSFSMRSCPDRNALKCSRTRLSTLSVILSLLSWDAGFRASVFQAWLTSVSHRPGSSMPKRTWGWSQPNTVYAHDSTTIGRPNCFSSESSNTGRRLLGSARGTVVAVSAYSRIAHNAHYVKCKLGSLMVQLRHPKIQKRS